MDEWIEFINEDYYELLQKILTKIKTPIVMVPENIKVVILGQDPYQNLENQEMLLQLVLNAQKSHHL
jgi:uracil DNA glycosylase